MPSTTPFEKLVFQIATTPGVDPGAAWSALKSIVPAKPRSIKPYSLVYDFDELRLSPLGGAALASGTARIAFDIDGDWQVEHLLLDPTSPREIAVFVDIASPLGRLIRDALQVRDADDIAAKIDVELRGEFGASPDLHAAE